MAKATTNGPATKLSISVNGTKTTSMEKATTDGQMEDSTKANG